MAGYTIKGLLFAVMPDAIARAGGRYPVYSQRDLYYKCRDAYMNHPLRPRHREYTLKRYPGETEAQYEARREDVRRHREPIDYKYFTTKVVRDYERAHGPNPGMIRESYGKFVEPHTGHALELGTREVASYEFPPHAFDKVLLVEKQTERPKFEHDRIAEKYDMAIVYSQGYATEALHDLLATAEDGDYQIFVWHDADVDGYNICRNLRAATANMPVSVEVIDIGLSVAEALRVGCSSEPFTTDDALPHELRATLSELELEYFEDRQIRFEINGIDPDERIAYVEDRLQAHGIRPKYIPPPDELQDLVDEDLRSDIAGRVSTAIDEMVDKDEIVSRVTDALWDALKLDDPTSFVRREFGLDPFLSWSDVVDREHRRLTHAKRDEIAEMVGDEIVSRVTGEADEDE